MLFTVLLHLALIRALICFKGENISDFLHFYIKSGCWNEDTLLKAKSTAKKVNIEQSSPKSPPYAPVQYQ